MLVRFKGANLLLLILCVMSLSARCNNSTQSSLDSIREEYAVPALGGLIQQDNSIAVFVSGVRKHDNATSVESSDKFHLGSNTKAMTSTLIAILVQSGEIQWETKLSDVFKEWSSTMDPKLKTVTLEMLGAHMSGITPDLLGFQNGILLKIAMDSRKSVPKIREETSRLILEAIPQTEPGSHFEYSNMNYIILGTVLEKITGLSWEQLIVSKIFQPLGMESCGFGPPGDVKAPNPDQPWAHQRTPSGIQSMPPDSNADNPPALGPAGTVHCSMGDWAKFLKIHRDGFNGLSSPILAAEGFKKLHQPYPGQEYTPGGWLRLERPWAEGPVLTHDGSNNGNFSTAWIAPKKNMVLLSVANIGGADEATDKVIQLLISDKSKLASRQPN